jgi:hypothetical protein
MSINQRWRCPVNPFPGSPPTNWVADLTEPGVWLYAGPEPLVLPELSACTLIGTWDLESGELIGGAGVPEGGGTHLGAYGSHSWMGHGTRQYAAEQFTPRAFSPEFSKEFA